MKKLIVLILLILHAIAINAQERSVRVNVVKTDPVTSTVRDAYVVPVGQIWKIYNSTTDQWEENNGGAGWVASNSGGSTTYTAGTGLALNAGEFSLDPALVTKLGHISVTQAVNLDDVVLLSGNQTISNTKTFSGSGHTRFENSDATQIDMSSTSTGRGFTFGAGSNANFFADVNTGFDFRVNGLTSRAFFISSNGTTKFSALEGTGDRMVVANFDGEISTQPIPSGGGADNLGNHTATQDLNLDDNDITNVFGIKYSAVLDAGTAGYTRMDHAGLLRRIETYNNNDKYTIRALTRPNTGSSFNVESEFEYDFVDQRWEIDDQPIISSGGTSYTDEQAQDAAASLFTSTGNITFVYDDFLPEMAAYIKNDAINSTHIADNSIGPEHVGTLTTDAISDTAATNKYVDSAEKAKIANAVEGTIQGRTGTQVTKILSQTAAQLATDGPANVGEIVFCSDCAPMAVQTSTTFNVDDYRGIDDKTTDSATYTFQNLEPGAIIEIEINRATDASYSGITFVPWPSEGTFSANTEQLVWIKILPSNRAIRKYIDLE